jgi:hypothetical protein
VVKVESVVVSDDSGKLTWDMVPFQALDQSLTRLWTGNSAGVVTSLSVIASGKVGYQQIAPSLVAFALGLAAMGIASCLELVANYRHFQANRRECPGAQTANELATRLLFRVALFSAVLFLSGMIWAILLTLYILIEP